MGTAELGRELGDAGGPLLVAGIAAATTLTAGYATLALILAAPPTGHLLRRIAAITAAGGAPGD
jgi:hypothetical protein